MIAASECSRDCEWINNMFNEIKINDITPIPFHVNNMGAVHNIQNPVTEGRTKHIAIQHFAIRDRVENGLIQPLFIEGVNNPADMFTKPLARQKFIPCREQLGMEFIQPYSPLVNSVWRSQ